MSGVMFALALVAVAAVFALLLTVGRVKALGTEVNALRKERDELHERAGKLSGKDKEQHKKLEERAEEIQALKQDLAALRKKHHAAQEEAKELRAQMRAQVEERDRLLAERPAFEPVQEKPKKVARPVEAPRQAEPAVVVAPVAAAPAQTDDETKHKLDKLEQKLADVSAALDQEKKANKGFRDEAHKLRRYTEQLRRIAVVSKGQVEALEERVSTLGRQYYDAVSELAALKGEVVPPKPRGLDAGERTTEMMSSDALSAQMDDAAREAQDPS